MRKVAKFGGTSLADANQFKKIKSIVDKDSDIICIVPSAPGKRYDSDIKVTDMLYECYNRLEFNIQDSIYYFECIKERFDSIISELSLQLDLSSQYETIIQNLSSGISHVSIDYLVSRGEYLCGIILAKYLNYEFIDPYNIIMFNSREQLDEVKSYSAIKNLSLERKMIIPGFYGKNINGQVKTFPRGGSDITGAVISRGLEVDVYENWTDVSGVYVIDPRLVEKPYVRKHISYKELSYLSAMGANVYHMDAIYPVMELGIPIHIRNTNDINAKGTIISDKTEIFEKAEILGITGKKGFQVYRRQYELSMLSIGNRIITKDFIAIPLQKEHKKMEHDENLKDSQLLILVVTNPKYEQELLVNKIKDRLKDYKVDYLISNDEREENLLYIATNHPNRNHLMSDIYRIFY